MLVTDDKSLDPLSVHIWRLNIEIRKSLDKCCAGPSIISSNQESVLVVTRSRDTRPGVRSSSVSEVWHKLLRTAGIENYLPYLLATPFPHLFCQKHRREKGRRPCRIIHSSTYIQRARCLADEGTQTSRTICSIFLSYLPLHLIQYEFGPRRVLVGPAYPCEKGLRDAGYLWSPIGRWNRNRCNSCEKYHFAREHPQYFKCVYYCDCTRVPLHDSRLYDKSRKMGQLERTKLAAETR